MTLNGCVECEKLRRAYQDAKEAQTQAAELLRLAMKHLGDGSITLDQHRQSAKDVRERLEVLRLALQKHEATHEQRD